MLWYVIPLTTLASDAWVVNVCSTMNTKQLTPSGKPSGNERQCQTIQNVIVIKKNP